jgi:ATP synthase protein I
MSDADKAVTHELTVQRLAGEMFREAAWAALGTFVLGVVVSTVIWGTAGLNGSLIGGAIAIGSSLATLLLMRKTAALDPMFVMVAALGGFMGKLIVLLLAVILLRNQSWLEPKALGITLVATVLVTSFLEARASKRSRSQMVVPASEGT